VIPLLFAALLSPQGEVRITEPGRAPVVAAFAPGTELRVHRAGHLTGEAKLAAALAEFAHPQPALAPAAAAALLDRLEARRREVESISRGLVETLRDLVQPPLGPGQRIEGLEGGRLACLGVPEQQAWLERFLAQAMAFDGLVDLQARIYEVEQADGLEPFLEHSGKTLTAAETDALLQLLARQQLEAIVAPRAVAFPFQEARLKSVDQIPYVRDFEIKVLPGPSPVEIADPIIDVVEDGVNLVLRGVPVGGGRLAVYAQLDYSRVSRPIRDVDMALTSGASVTLQHPEVTHLKVQGRFELAIDETLLLFGSLERNEGGKVLVLLRARQVPEIAEPASERR
jgi:hypothetical protein